MNEYIVVNDLKAEQSITGSGDDALLKDKCTQASRIWDRLTRRFFFELAATYRFDFQEGYVLMLYDQDLLSLTTLTNGDGNALGTYYLYPLRFSPKRWIELDQSGGDIFTYSTTPQRCIQVAGLWGYHADYDYAWASSGDEVENNPLTAAGTTLTVNNGVKNFKVQQMLKIESEQVYVVEWQDSSDTVQDAPLMATATTLNVSDGTLFKVNQTLRVDAEEMLVTGISTNALTVTRARGNTYGASHAAATAIYTTDVTGNSLTVERGCNGTTAASHVQNTAITIWQPDPDVQRWVLRLAAWLYAQKDAPFERTASIELGTVTIPAAMPPDIAAAAKGYRRVRIG